MGLSQNKITVEKAPVAVKLIGAGGTVLSIITSFEGTKVELPVFGSKGLSANSTARPLSISSLNVIALSR